MKFTGICYIKIDGVLQESKEGAKLALGGMGRTPQFSNGAVVGYTEKPKEATIEATFLDGPNSDLRELSDIAGVTVEFETDSGVSYIVREAFVTEPVELTAGDGEVSVKMAGKAAVKA
jgi:hypothetical protein